MIPGREEGKLVSKYIRIIAAIAVCICELCSNVRNMCRKYAAPKREEIDNDNLQVLIKQRKAAEKEI